MNTGLYGPGSLTWELTRPRAMLLGGPRALVLQLAHPLVAAGVGEHSSFAADPLLRLRRTLDATLAMVFGTTAQAEAAAAQVTKVHGYVHGRLPEPAGRFEAGTPYDALDPELLLWVHATLVDTTLLTYGRFVRPLHDDEQEEAYRESKVVATLLGVPAEILPADRRAFGAYVEDMLASDSIAAAPFQRALVGEVLYPNLRFVPRPAWWPGVAITTSLLPPRIRELYGLALTVPRRLVANWSRAAVRGILPVMPAVVRDQPQARAAERRTEGARQTRGEP